MTTRRLFVRAAAVLALLAGATFASADDKKLTLNHELDHYFKIQVALAADKLDGVKEDAEHLAKSEDKETATAADALGKAKEIAAVRKAFGDVSKLLIARVEAATKKGEKVTQAFIFECPMAKPYGRWLQSTKDIANPYYGASMLKCGKLLGSKGDAKCADGCCDDDKKDKKEDKDHKDDHHDHDHK